AANSTARVAPLHTPPSRAFARPAAERCRGGVSDEGAGSSGVREGRPSGERSERACGERSERASGGRPEVDEAGVADGGCRFLGAAGSPSVSTACSATGPLPSTCAYEPAAPLRPGPL
ncbi:hypothetical protein KN815_45505, partial [Streptomyces sp. 4503]|nr:hypothetical protein [Streptomyces niphimycinicus]